MNKSDNLAKELSEQLAKIFYCVAAADKIIRKEEVYSLQNILKDQWTDLDTVSPSLPESFGGQMQLCFEEILKNEPDVESTISEFKDFFKNHENLFSDS